jgi:hypothetical protein
MIDLPIMVSAVTLRDMPAVWHQIWGFPNRGALGVLMAGGHRSRRRGNGMGMNSPPIPGRESAFDTADRSAGQCGSVSEQQGQAS